MDIVLYFNESEKNKIDKKLSSEKTIHGELRDECSVISPIIRVEAESFPNYNYAYIKDFSRFYFIDSITAVSNTIYDITLSVDVLESFKSDIKKLRVILSDTEVTGANNYISGDQWVTNVKNFTDIIQFPSGLMESGEYILITAGG